MLEQYLPIGIMLLIGIAFGLVMGKVNEWFGPKNSNEIKLSTYESGMPPVRSAHERISVKFYMVAMLFIIFDIEVVFLYPWAVNFRELGLFGFIEMLVFIVILMLGFLYVWKKGALEWTSERTKNNSAILNEKVL
ncbi:MAG: NADH-quinone oxidoreductase subunit A [Ignavibacteriae bacterium]|nr:NADH-quinone oxidoreductase subunit A [Ignavibacteriota bacterium]